MLFIALMAKLLISGCQEEIPLEVIVDNEEAIAPQSELSQLIVRMTALDGSSDNIIDRSSCTTIVFPITGLYEDNEVRFYSLDEIVALGIEALDIEWVYPIRVILADHTEMELINSDELENIRDNCIEGGDDPDIECIDFTYPITLSTFNDQTEEVKTEMITSDKEAYRIFNDPKQLVSIEYPLNLVDLSGALYQVDNNEQLFTVIKDAQGTCNEKDIIEFDESLFTELGQLLTAVEWKITLFEDGEDLTYLFNGYTVTFQNDLTVIASSDNEFSGEWELDSNDSMDFLEIYFETEDPSFVLLNNSWKVISFDQTTIYMEAESDDGTTVKKLQLEAL